MRVGVVAEQLRQDVPGGIGTYVTGLLQGLASLSDPDVEVIALASRCAGRDPLEELAEEVATWWGGHRLLVARWDRGLGRPKVALDQLHLTSLAGPLKPAPGVGLSVMVHDLAWRANPALTTARGARWHEAAYGRVRGSSALVVTPSMSVAASLGDDGVSAERIHVVPEGSDHLPEPDEVAASALLEAHGINGPFLLSVSTLEPRKNLGRLLEAFAAADGSLPPLVLVGPEGWGPALAPVHGVVLVGRQEGATLAALYRRCTAFVYVPLLEGYGLPPLEALSEGAAVVVSTATPSTADSDGVWHAVATQTATITDALVAAVTEGAEREARRARGRSFARQRRWVDTAAAHVELWRSGR